MTLVKGTLLRLHRQAPRSKKGTQLAIRLQCDQPRPPGGLVNSLHTRDKSKGNGRKEVPRRRSSGGFGRWPDLRARVNLPETDGTQKEGVGVFFCRTPFGVKEKPKDKQKDDHTF